MPTLAPTVPEQLDTPRAARTAMASNLSALPHKPHIWQLDAIRGVAALYLVIYHWGILKHGKLGALFSLGPEGVIVFFVLSGFVISYATEGRTIPLTFREYFVRRFNRIYPLFLFSLPFAYAFACISQKQFVPVQLTSLLGNLVMLQDDGDLKAGRWFSAYQHNDPLWSLSYEWWFYMAFALLTWGRLKMPATRQKSLVLTLAIAATVSYIVMPSYIALVASYLFIWWCGVEFCREHRAHQRITWRGQRFCLLGMTTLTALWAMPVVLAVLRHEPIKIGLEPVLELRHFLAADAVLVAVLAYFSRPLPQIALLLRPFHPVGKISYALYILHAPVLFLSGNLAKSIGLLLLFPLCYVLEILLQPRIDQSLRRLLTPPTNQ